MALDKDERLSLLTELLPIIGLLTEAAKHTANVDAAPIAARNHAYRAKVDLEAWLAKLGPEALD